MKASLLMRTDKSMCIEQRAASDGDRRFSETWGTCADACVYVGGWYKNKKKRQLKADIVG